MMYSKKWDSIKLIEERVSGTGVEGVISQGGRGRGSRLLSI